MNFILFYQDDFVALNSPFFTFLFEMILFRNIYFLRRNLYLCISVIKYKTKRTNDIWLLIPKKYFSLIVTVQY